MWSSRTEQFSNGRVIKYAINADSAPLSYADVLTRWQNDSAFREYFFGLLIEAPFLAYRWETPPISIATASQPFEFVLLDSPSLACGPDTSAFAEHFSKSTPGGIVEFANLGHDAILIVPSPIDVHSDYGHLAAFMRNSDMSQQHLLWRLVGEVTQRQLGKTPVWLSTAGAGVAWLHVRIDDWPKYYGYEPYRHAA